MSSRFKGQSLESGRVGQASRLSPASKKPLERKFLKMKTGATPVLRRGVLFAAAIPMVPATNANDIRDIKPPIAIPNGWEWLWWTLGSMIVVTLLLLAWRYLHKRMTHVPVEPPVPAHVRAKQKLEEALALISQPKEFCVLVSDTIRFYLEERFDFRAPERTTEEFLRELNATDLLLPEQKESLGKFLESCDLVKFAKYEPGENELRELHGSAVKLVVETEPREIPKAESQILNTESQIPIVTSEPGQIVNRKS